MFETVKFQLIEFTSELEFLRAASLESTKKGDDI